MVVTRKHDGSPRRIVDLSPLNKHCQRETHSTESPFCLARLIPRNTWKTVTYAWNGYHSMLLLDSDHHLTTLVIPFGCWRYKRAPQGFLSSGDGYNCWFDAILADFNGKECVVEDTIFYNNYLVEHWWRTMFQFAAQEVDFAAFRITNKRIDALPKFCSSIHTELCNICLYN